VTASIAEHKAEIMDLCRRCGVKRLEFFGSAAAEGRESPDSDLDFFVDFGSRPTPGYADAYFGLSEALADFVQATCRPRGGVGHQESLLPRIGAAFQDAPLCGLRRRSTSSTSSAQRR
jgi:predicted nucleotidyltransferase